MRSLVFSVVSILVCGCDSPARSASGEAIASVTWQEHFARTNDVRSTELSGKSLRQAMPLLDQNQILSLKGEHAAKGKVDESFLVLTVKPENQPERTFTMKNCAEPRVCAFLKGAIQEGVVEKLPALCRAAPPCE